MTKHSTYNSKIIKASQEKIYKAFTDPTALSHWFAPGEMTAEVLHFDLRVGGGYQMSLKYPDSVKGNPGKTTEKEDRYTTKFIELKSPDKIVQTISFETDQPDFVGEMIMEINLERVEEGTKVSIYFNNIPAGIKPSDNEKGTELSLQKLADFIKHNP